MVKIIDIDRGKTKDTIPLNEVYRDQPIFVERDGKLCGMVVHEDNGWTIRTGGYKGITGHCNALKGCLISGFRYDLEYFVEES